MTWQTIKTLGISAVLLIPALQGMQKINEESLPVQVRHRGYTPLHIAVYLGAENRLHVYLQMVLGGCKKY